MKLKFIAIAAAMASCIFTANAQQEEKLGNDIFMAVSGGVMSPVTTTATNTLRLNTPGFYASLELGKYFTPVWGGRIVLGAGNQRYDLENRTWDIQGSDFWNNFGYPVTFGEINLDGMLNFSQLFSKKSMPLVDFYIFAGPTVNFATRATKFTGETSQSGVHVVEACAKNDIVARWGATAGLGIMFNINKYIALGIEGRSAVAPSIFGATSKGRYAENNNRLTLRLAYTFGGKLGKDGFAKKYGRVETVEVPVEKVVEKEVVKEVVKEVEKVVEIANPAANSVFFAIGKANIDNQDKVRLSQYAKAIKEGSKDAVYTVAGYCDKGTGSAAYNQQLSEKRAKAVFDYLVSEGVNPAQLKIEANGGVGNMFFDQAKLSRVVILGK